MRGVARGGVIFEFKRRRNVDIRKVESWSSMETKGRQSRGVFWLMSLCWTGESVDVKGTGEGNRKGRQDE